MSQIISLFGLGQASLSVNVSAQQRLNLYYALQADADKSRVVACATPGLKRWCEVSASPSRGLHWLETANTLFVVQRNWLYGISGDGRCQQLAALADSDLEGWVTMADNGPQLAIASGAKLYLYDTGSQTLETVTLPFEGQAPVSVCFLDGYLVVNRPDSGQFFISDPYNGRVFQALNYATAESNPDSLLAVAAERGLLALFGSASVELWADSGDPLFPFARVNGAVCEGGLAARWSLARCQGLLTGLFRNRQGALAVAQLTGYNLVPLSTPELDSLFSGYSGADDAVGFGYTVNGRAFYQLSFQQAQQSWLYDFQSQVWSRLKSPGLNRHLGSLGVAAFGKFIVADHRNGNLYQLCPDTVTEDGLNVERELIGRHLASPSGNASVIRRLRVDLETGVGLPTGLGSEPKLMLQISRDGGHTWGLERWVALGRLGEFRRRAEWRRLGAARDWLFKLRVTDPVKLVIIQAVAEITPLGK